MVDHAAPPVHLHVGPPKTGTSFVQEIIWRNLPRLGELGWTVAASSYAEHSRAASDLLGRGPDRRAGSWDALAARIRASDAAVLISQELLAHCGEQQVTRVVSELAPRPVSVVVTCRDPARQIASVWQQQVKQRSTATFDEYVQSAKSQTVEPEGWWQFQDLPAILERWLGSLPTERVIAVIVPPCGSAPELLWERFALANGIPSSGFALDVDRPNESLGAVQTELLRRVNVELGDRLPLEEGYRSLVRRIVANDMLAVQPVYRPIAIARDAHRWATELGCQWRDAIDALGVRVVGDLKELVPAAYQDDAAGSPSESEIAASAAALLADLLARWPVRGRDTPRTDESHFRRGGASRRPAAASAEPAAP